MRWQHIGIFLVDKVYWHFQKPIEPMKLEKLVIICSNSFSFFNHEVHKESTKVTMFFKDSHL
jgi:hypothetical protein